MELEQGVATGMEKALWISSGLASLTNRWSFTMHRLEEKQPLKQLNKATTPVPLPPRSFLTTVTQQWDSFHTPTELDAQVTWLAPMEPTFGETVYQLHWTYRFNASEFTLIPQTKDGDVLIPIFRERHRVTQRSSNLTKDSVSKFGGQELKWHSNSRAITLNTLG